jgi:lysyl-tRNA synthetase class 2
VSDQERASRRARLEALREQGIDPYPARVGPRDPIAGIRSRFGERDAAALEVDPQTVAVAGRIVAIRSFGKLVFLRLVEAGDAIQVSARKEEIDAELFDWIRSFDVGDFVRFEGPVWRTRTGELTVDAKAAQILAKSLLPLPEKWHGLTDVESRFRQRYLDLLSNEQARSIAVLRSRTLSATRAFLDARGFLEVETPVLQPIYGGAAARPFDTHHHRYDQKLYLRISDELYLKRLVVGGLDRVYEIGHNFRNEGISRKHNPEFTMMECYQAYADYRDMMDLHDADRVPGPQARPRCAVAEASDGRRDPRRHRGRRPRARRSRVTARSDAQPGFRAERCAHLGPARGRSLQRSRGAGSRPAHLHHRLPPGALAAREAIGRGRPTRGTLRALRGGNGDRKCLQ